jgi:hypothetical protein
MGAKESAAPPFDDIKTRNKKIGGLDASRGTLGTFKAI